MDKKRKRDFKTRRNFKTQESMSNISDFSSCKKSEVILVDGQEKKNINAFANITHKNSFGANNWKKFMEKESQENAIKLNKNENQRSKSSISKQFNDTQINPILDSNSCALDNNDGQQIIEQQKQNISGKRKPKLVVVQESLVNSLSRKNKPFANKSLSHEKSVTGPENALTKQVAMDCEMVAVEVGVQGNMLGRVSLVNALGDCIYDKFVKPTEPVIDYRTHVSGIRPKDLENATDFKIVQKEVADIIKGRILVGHALKNDLSVLFLTHPKRSIRDTSKYKRFREEKVFALKKLTKKYLGVVIQEGEHSSVQDALAAMQLYRMFRKEWEASLRPIKPKKLNNQDVMLI